MRRKTTRRATSTRRPAPIRRRISGVKSNPIMKIAGLAGGAILARLANNLILKAKPDLNGKIINAAQIGLGIYLPKLVKSELGKDLGAGMIAAGGLGLATSLGVINGIDVVSGMEVVSGTDDEMVELAINGYEDSEDVVAGFDYGQSFGGLDAVSGIDEDDISIEYEDA